MEVSLKRYAYLIGSAALVVFLGLFGTGILNNVHNSYLRLLSNWTVKLTNQAGNSGATGFVVKGNSGETYIMTNAHVCGLAENGMLSATYRGETFQVEVYKKYEFNDLCALRAHRPLGWPVHIASSVALGESTWVIGHPLLEPRSVSIGELSGSVFVTVTVGVNLPPGQCDGPTYHRIDMMGSFLGNFLSISDICVRQLEAYASTMSIQPGNSGSPSVNVYGSVVAVAFAANESGTRSYFVPLVDLKDFLGEL
jgi:S1-C subfamily serine protease